MRAMVIEGPTRDYWKEVELTDDPNKLLDELQKRVGGWIEGLSGEAYILFCNEEGKLKHLEPVLYWCPNGLEEGRADVIMGHCVLVGAPDQEGDCTPLTNAGLVEFGRHFEPYRTVAQEAERIREGVKRATKS